MALHMRDQIMDAIGAALGALTTTGARVYLDRDDLTEPLSGEELPGLTIVQGEDSSEPLNLNVPDTIRAVLDVDVVAHVKRTTNTATRKQLNLISQEVQVAIGANRTLSGLCERVYPVQATPEIIGDGDKPMGRLRMRYQVIYLYRENAPDAH